MTDFELSVIKAKRDAEYWRANGRKFSYPSPAMQSQMNAEMEEAELHLDECPLGVKLRTNPLVTNNCRSVTPCTCLR